MLIDFNSGKGLFLQFVGLPTITQTHEHKTILSLFKKTNNSMLGAIFENFCIFAKLTVAVFHKLDRICELSSSSNFVKFLVVPTFL